MSNYGTIAINKTIKEQAYIMIKGAKSENGYLAILDHDGHLHRQKDNHYSLLNTFSTPVLERPSKDESYNELLETVSKEPVFLKSRTHLLRALDQN